MSYDLEVYGKTVLSTRELVEVIAADRGLKAQVDKEADAVDAVALRRTGAHFFTIDGPMEVEPEDLPEGWAEGEGEGATVLYSLNISYDVSSGAEGFSFSADGATVDAATAFAERLAKRIDGAVMDPQTWEPPGSGSVRLHGSSESSAVPRFLHVEWFYTESSPSLASAYFDAAREMFPQGVPLRFGTHDPMAGKVPQRGGGDGGLGQFYRAECAVSPLFVNGRGPFLRGLISGWSDSNWWASIYLTFELDGASALDAEALQVFFVDFARRTGSFFAFAEVRASEFSSSFPLSSACEWPGLPRVPQWLTWFSAEYSELIKPFLMINGRGEYPEGLAHRWTDAPASADEIAPLLRRSPWVPEKFLPRQNDREDPRQATKPARVIPASLRGFGGGEERSLWARLLGRSRSD